MLTRHFVVCTTLALIALVSVDGATAAEFWAGTKVGYRGGAGGQIDAGVSEFAVGFPLALRVAVGYSTREAGRAADARRIFINNATNGTPEEHGSFRDFRFDLMYPISWRSSQNLYLSGGVRYAKSKSNFKYIGGNEDFDITSEQWGLGMGVEGFFPVSHRIDLMLGGGLDYYFDSVLTGHDTSYSPDGDDVNPREEFTYSDADDAVNQPEFDLRTLIGLRYRFGQ